MRKKLSQAEQDFNAAVRRATTRQVFTVGADGKPRSAATGEFVGSMNDCLRRAAGRTVPDTGNGGAGDAQN